MGCFSATHGVLFLFGFITLSVAKEDTCDLYAAVGESLTLPSVNEGLAKTHVLKWTHNNTLIFHRQQEKVLTGKKEDTSANGSLLLKNLQFSGAGTYEAAVQHSAGSSAKTWTGRLCIMSKVSKPQVTYECDFKSSAVNLTCNVAKPQGLMFSWTHGEKTLTSEKRQTLSISLAQLKGERRFACTVENKVSKERSDTVHPTCKDPSPSPPIVLCFTSKTVVAVLAGGAGLTLLLLIIIIILCCCLRRNKTQMELGEKGQLKMTSVKKREPDSISPEYETMHLNENSPPPNPKPSPNTSHQNVPQPDNQTENMPSQLSAAVEGLQPSPVPKPRTKRPLTPNI